MSKEKLKILLETDCYVPTATIAFLASFGLEALEWDPVIVKKEVEETLERSVSEKVLDKIMTGSTLIYTNIAEIYPAAFINICHVCADNQPDMDTWEHITWEELVQGLVDITFLTHKQFSPWHECEAYIKLVLHEAGFSKVPQAIAKLANIDDLSIPFSKNENEEVQQEKEEAILDYVKEVLRVRTEQLKKLEDNEA